MDEKTEHLKRKAEIFLRNNIRAFIKDVYYNYHFCLIKEIGEDWVIIEHFKGKRFGEVIRILWIDIKVFDEYREDLE